LAQKDCTICPICYIRDDLLNPEIIIATTLHNTERSFLPMTANTRKKSAQTDKELEQKRMELATLKNRLCHKERVKLNLQWETTDFRKIYTESLAPRIAELDTLNKRLAEIRGELSRDNPAEPQTGEQFSFGVNEDIAEEDTDERCDWIPSGTVPTIKELYRRVAKSIHPDLSTDQEERKWRQKLMAEANNAYAKEDGDSLRAILRQWEGSPDSGICGGMSAELMHITRNIFTVREKLRLVEEEILSLKRSDMYRLMTRIDEALCDGVDLLAEIAAKIDEDIASVRDELLETDHPGTWQFSHRTTGKHAVRTVCFPKDDSIGVLFTRKPDSDSFLDWYRLGEAIGTVHIPAGKALRLDIPEGSAEALATLQNLQANDLQALFLHKPKGLDLQGIRSLTGLTELYLSGSGVTNDALSNILRFDKLHRLYLYETQVNDTGVEGLKELNSLRYLTLSGSKVTETALNILRKALPSCRIVTLQTRGKR
jgi:hypothetical protein